MRKRSILVPAVGLACLMTLPAIVAAQHDEEACGSAEAALRGKPRGGSYHRALGILMGCPIAGPRALATEWGQPPGDTVDLRVLGDASAWLGDRRILQAVRAAALNPSHDRRVRLTAIRALVGQFDPCLDVAYRTPPSLPGLGGSAYVMLLQSVHPSGRRGAEPLSVAGRNEVLDVLRELKNSDADEVVQKVAGYLLERLEAMKDDGSH